MNLEKITYADLVNRAVAVLIDGAIIYGILYVINFDLFSLAHNKLAMFDLFILVIIALSYHTLLNLPIIGATPGKRIVGIKIISLGKTDLTVLQLILRYFMSCLSSGGLLVGYLVAFFNPRRQTFHDMVAKTAVVFYDFKAKKVKEDMFESSDPASKNK